MSIVQAQQKPVSTIFAEHFMRPWYRPLTANLGQELPTISQFLKIKSAVAKRQKMGLCGTVRKGFLFDSRFSLTDEFFANYTSGSSKHRFKGSLSNFPFMDQCLYLPRKNRGLVMLV
jgi:hypothetical protein